MSFINQKCVLYFKKSHKDEMKIKTLSSNIFLWHPMAQFAPQVYTPKFTRGRNLSGLGQDQELSKEGESTSKF